MKRAGIQTGDRPFGGRKKRPQILVVSYWQDEVMMDAIGEEAAKHDWDMMDVRFFGGNRFPADYKPDGLLVCRNIAKKRLEGFKTFAAPIVMVGFWELGYAVDTPLVTEDEESIGRMAAAHFLERGFRNIGYAAIESDFVDMHNQRLYQRFRAHLAETGVTCMEPLLLPSFDDGDDQERRRAFTCWLDKARSPVGLLVFRDILAGNLCGMCRLNGVAVPEQVAILGIGNRHRYCKLSPCPLSSVDPDSAAQGRVAVQMLQRMMQGDPCAPGLVRIPPSGVVTRQSTDVLAAGDPIVTNALQFLWSHLDMDLSVDHVAEAVGCSRYKLEKAFRQHLHRGVNAELRRRRVQELARLLRESDLPIADLGPMVGFRSMKHLHRSFRQIYDTSPRAYRNAGRQAK